MRTFLLHQKIHGSQHTKPLVEQSVGIAEVFQVGGPCFGVDLWDLDILKLIDLAALIDRLLNGYNPSNMGILDMFLLEYRFVGCHAFFFAYFCLSDFVFLLRNLCMTRAESMFVLPVQV